METVIVRCRESGKSWVATDADGNFVGFALAKPDFNDDDVLSLRYIAVDAASRKQGIFTTLIDKLKAYGMPIEASVLAGNTSGMSDILPKVRFVKGEDDGKETDFRWDPPPPL